MATDFERQVLKQLGDVLSCVSRMDERTKQLDSRISRLEDEIVTQNQFRPIQRYVYGLVSVTVIGALSLAATLLTGGL